MKEETEKNKAGVKTKCVARRLINGKSKKVGENCNASEKNRRANGYRRKFRTR